MYDLEQKVLKGIQKFEVVKDFFENDKMSDAARQDVELWNYYYDETNIKLSGAFYRDITILYTAGKISIEGIASEFSKIKTEDELIQFAQTYGMLGLTMSKDFTHIAKDANVLTNSIPFFLAEHGNSYFEPFELWWYHIQSVHNLMRLYRALLRHQNEQTSTIEDNIIRIGKPIDIDPLIKKDLGIKTNRKFFVLWSDGKRTETKLTEEEVETMSFVEIGRRVLVNTIKSYLGGIKITLDRIVESEKTPLGFYAVERKVTPYLITAIYYDLWNSITNNVTIEICQNPKCQLPFMKMKRQTYCGNACKQEAYRLRKEQAK